MDSGGARGRKPKPVISKAKLTDEERARLRRIKLEETRRNMAEARSKGITYEAKTTKRGYVSAAEKKKLRKEQKERKATQEWIQNAEDMIHETAEVIVHTMVDAVEHHEITMKEGTLAARKLKSAAVAALQQVASEDIGNVAPGILDAYNREQVKVIDRLNDTEIIMPPEEGYFGKTRDAIKDLIEEVRNEEDAGVPTAKQIHYSEFKFARRRDFAVEGAHNLEEYFDVVKEVSKPSAIDTQARPMVKMRFIAPDGDMRYITINPDHTGTFEEFSNQIYKIRIGDYQDSDPIADDYHPDLDYMVIMYNMYPSVMYNKVNKDYFLFAEQPEASYSMKEDTLCIWNAVFGTAPGTRSPLAGKYDEKRPIDKKETCLVDFNKQLVEKYQYSLRVYYDFPERGIDQSNMEYCYAPGGTKMFRLPKVTKLKRRDYGGADDRVEIVHYNKHVEPYRGIRDTPFWLDHRMNICRFTKDNKPIAVTRDKILRRAGVELAGDNTNIVFDLETVYNPDTEQLSPYSISFKDGNKVFFKLSEPDDLGNKPTRKFLEYLYATESKRRYTLVGYNSSRFDNQFLIRDLLDMDLMQSVFYQGSSILNIKWGGRHTTHDICRYTALSLDDCCEAMKTTYKKQTGTITHSDVQRHYTEHGNVAGFFHEEGCTNKCAPLKCFTFSDMTQAGIEKVIKRDIGCECKKYYDLVLYNTFDVLATDEIYQKVETALTETKTIPKGKLLSDYKTIGGLIFKKFKSDLRYLSNDRVDVDDPRIERVIEPIVSRSTTDNETRAFLQMLVEPKRRQEVPTFKYFKSKPGDGRKDHEVLEKNYKVDNIDDFIVQVEDDKDGRTYMMFKSIAQYQHYFPADSVHCTHEVILGHRPQKVKFDLDHCSTENMKLIVAQIMKTFKQQYNADISFIDCDASGMDSKTGTMKFSHHLIGRDYMFACSDEAKAFTELVISALPQELKKYVDNTNAKLQHFRMANTTRNSRKMIIKGASSFHDTLVTCEYSALPQYGIVNKLSILPRLLNSGSTKFVEQELTSTNVKAIVDMVEKDQSLKYESVNTKGLVAFKRVSSAFCKCCERTHDGSRGSFAWIWGTSIWRKCFNSGKAIKLSGEVEEVGADDLGVKLPLFTHEEYKLCRASLFAGRTQCFGGPSSGELIDSPGGYRMVDVASMYPYVMTTQDFPCGEITEAGEVSFEQCIARGRIGFYDCVIKQDAAKNNIIPLRGKTLDWECKDNIILSRLNTIDICECQKRGWLVSVGDGVCFTGKISGKHLFKCILKFKAIKMQEDLYKATKDSKCNPGMRKVAKDCMNCLSGKVIENLHLDKHELVRTQGHYEKLMYKAMGFYDEAGIFQGPNMYPSEIFDGKAAIVSYKLDENDVFKKDNRPIYLGICIYAYARRHLYNTVLENYNPIYCDTDSALIKYADFKRFEVDQPSLCGWLNPTDPVTKLQTLVDFGQYTEEDGSENMIGYTCIAPKNYFIYGKAVTPKAIKAHPDMVKKGFKGVNPGADRFIPDPSLFPDAFIKHDTRDEYRVRDQKTVFALYHSDALLKIQQCPREFVATIKSQGHAFVLCSSLQKTVRSTKDKEVNGQVLKGNRQAGGIYQRWVVKKIQSH